MRTLLLFLFFACLTVLMYSVEAAQWIISMTRPALIERRHAPPVQHSECREVSL